MVVAGPSSVHVPQAYLPQRREMVVEAGPSLTGRAHQTRITAVRYLNFMYVHLRTHTHTHGTDGIYCAGEDTVPTVNPPSGATGLGGQGVKKPTRGGARATSKATITPSAVKGRAGGQGRGPTGGMRQPQMTVVGHSSNMYMHKRMQTHKHTHTHTPSSMSF